MKFRRATNADIDSIVRVVNRAYRGGETGEKTWTSEAHLVGGLRISAQGVRDHMNEENAWFELAFMQDQLVGSVYLKAESPHSLYLGMFAVDPSLQGKSIGKQFLNHIEALARSKRFSQIRMTVIHLRLELIEYYERRGYAKTGRDEPFPFNDPNVGVPLVAGLKLIELIKELNA